MCAEYICDAEIKQEIVVLLIRQENFKTKKLRNKKIK